MTTLSAALGDKFKAKKNDLLIRSFDLGGHTFRVRIPLVSESDLMYKKINSPEQGLLDSAFSVLTDGLMQFRDAPADGLEFVGDDIIVSGRSMREAAKNKVTTEMRIVEFMKLLVPEVSGATLDDLTYKDIEDEFPFSVQLSLVEKIAEAISPGYKEIRKN